MARLNRIELQKADGLYDGLVRIERSGDDLVLADAATPAGASLTDLLNSVSQEDVEDIVAGLLNAGANITLNYDDATGSLTIASTASGGIPDTGARVYNSAALAVPDSTTVNLTFDSQKWDTHGLHDPLLNSDRFTIQDAGTYLVHAYIGWTGHPVGRRWLSITLNGATRIAINTMYPTDGNSVYQTVSAVYRFNPGDTVIADVHQTSGSTIDVIRSDARSPEFSIQRLA